MSTTKADLKNSGRKGIKNHFTVEECSSVSTENKTIEKVVTWEFWRDPSCAPCFRILYETLRSEIPECQMLAVQGNGKQAFGE